MFILGFYHAGCKPRIDKNYNFDFMKKYCMSVAFDNNRCVFVCVGLIEQDCFVHKFARIDIKWEKI